MGGSTPLEQFYLTTERSNVVDSIIFVNNLWLNPNRRYALIFVNKLP